MNRQTVFIALTAALLATPGGSAAQVNTHEVGHWLGMPGGALMTIPGLAGEHPAKVIAPQNFLEQLRSGTLRQLELEVAPGLLNDALARSHRTRGRLSAVGVKAKGETGDYLVVTLKDARVTSYNLSGSSDADRFGRVKVQFSSSPVSQSAGAGAPVPGIEGSPIGTVGAPQQPPTPGIEGSPVGTAGAPQQPPKPGIEGSPVGTAGAPSGRPRPGTVQLSVADLLPLNGLRVGPKLIQWGQTETISADQASSKQGGRCEFRYRYDTGNQGNAASGPATNLVLLNQPNGAALAQDALPGLAVATQHTSSGTLWLVPGTWTIYVHADGKQDVAEGDEQNNLRRVRVQVEGSCA
jgi:hypothetical protein